MIYKLFSIFIFLISFSGIHANTTITNNICSSDTDEYIFVNSHTDLDSLEDCHTINGSLFINGGYDVTNVNHLSNLRTITGSLVILDSHELENVYGLHNLESINGDNLYLDRYSVVIRHNHYTNDTSNGLCYIDTIDWSNITYDETWIANNAAGCPNCDPNCNGCWDSGPRKCQFCRYYKSGFTCVSECSLGTILDGSNCLESLPNAPQLTSNSVSTNFVELNIEYPSYPNGVILGTEIYQDNMLIHNHSVIEHNNLIYNYTIYGLAYNTEYNFSTKIYNSIGFSNYSNLLNITTLHIYPSSPTNVIFNNITNHSANISWNSNDVMNNYNIELSLQNNIINNFITSEPYFYLNELNPNRNYSIRIKALNNLGYYSNYTNFYNFSTLIGIPPIPTLPVINQLQYNKVSFDFTPGNPINGPITKYSIDLYNQTTSNLYSGTYLSNLFIDNLLSATNYTLGYTIYTSDILFNQINISFMTPTTTTTSSTLTTTTTLTTSNTVTTTNSNFIPNNTHNNHHEDDDNKIWLIVLLVILGIAIVVAIIVIVKVYRDRQQRLILSRLEGRYNNGTDSTVGGNQRIINSFANPVYLPVNPNVDTTSLNDRIEPDLVPTNTMYDC
jgi:hypothetical protein